MYVEGEFVYVVIGLGKDLMMPKQWCVKGEFVDDVGCKCRVNLATSSCVCLE